MDRELNTTQARAGETKGGMVRTVLVAGIVLAIIAFVVIYLFVR